MRALQFKTLKAPLELVERPSPEPGAGEVVVTLKAAALNRRDYWITQGLYPGIKTPVVLGSDGAGIVTRLGAGTDSSWLNQEVVLFPGFDWGDDPRAQSKDFRALGMPDDGTLAEQIVVPQECLFSKPAHLTWAAAAALPLAGCTAYRALFTQGRCRAKEKVLITGVGGGVSSLALSLAVAAGANVFVTSSSPQKLERAQQLGAIAGFDYTQSDWSKSLVQQHGSIDLIVDSAGGPAFNELINLADRGGRIVTYGATAGRPPELDLFKLFWKQLHIIGASMGSPDDFKELLEFVSRHQIEPVVDHVYTLGEGNDGFKQLARSDQFGKIVIDLQG